MDLPTGVEDVYVLFTASSVAASPSALLQAVAATGCLPGLADASQIRAKHDLLILSFPASKATEATEQQLRKLQAAIQPGMLGQFNAQVIVEFDDGEANSVDLDDLYQRLDELYQEKLQEADPELLPEEHDQLVDQYLSSLQLQDVVKAIIGPGSRPLLPMFEGDLDE